MSCSFPDSRSRSVSRSRTLEPPRGEVRQRLLVPRRYTSACKNARKCSAKNREGENQIMAVVKGNPPKKSKAAHGGSTSIQPRFGRVLRTLRPALFSKGLSKVPRFSPVTIAVTYGKASAKRDPVPRRPEIVLLTGGLLIPAPSRRARRGSNGSSRPARGPTKLGALLARPAWFSPTQAVVHMPRVATMQ